MPEATQANAVDEAVVMPEEYTPDVLSTEDPLETGKADDPIPEPDAHRGTILSVSHERSEKGNVSIIFKVHSDDAGFGDERRLFPPAEFVENIRVSPDSLPKKVRKIVDGVEKEVNGPHVAYARDIASSSGNGFIQIARAIAARYGKTAAGYEPPKSFEEYVALLSLVLEGTPVVFTRSPDRPQPGFSPRLRVRSFYHQDDVLGGKIKLERFRKAWEN